MVFDWKGTQEFLKVERSDEDVWEVARFNVSFWASITHFCKYSLVLVLVLLNLNPLVI